MKRTENKIRKAFENATPNVLNTVLSECCEEKGTVIPMTEKKKNRFKLKEFAATAAAVVLLFGVGYFAAGMIGSHGQFSQGPSSGGQIDATTDSIAEFIGQTEAEQIALKDIFKDDLEKLEYPPVISSALIETSDTPYYDVFVNFSNQIHNYKIHAYKGTIIQSNTDTNSITKVITRQAALDIALKHTNLVTLKYITELDITLSSKFSTTIYDVSFEGSTYAYEYDYIIDAFTGNVLDHEVENIKGEYPELTMDGMHPRHLCVDIAIDNAGISKDEIYYLDTEFENNCYSIVFFTDGRDHNYKIDAVTGEILQPAASDPTPDPSPTVPPDGKITANDAINLAVEHFNLDRSNVMYEYSNLDNDKNFPHYDVSFYCNGYEYECEVGIYSREIRDAEKEPLKYGGTSDSSSSQLQISLTSKGALEAAANYFNLDVSKLKQKECEIDDDDGKHLHYDVSFEYEGYDYECEVDAYDGTIRNAEKERDD